MFIDGCFWHSCPEHGTIPKSNQGYWVPKLKQNVDRDRSIDRGLRADGWKVLRFWEHDNLEEAKVGVISAVDQVSNPDSVSCSCRA